MTRRKGVLWGPDQVSLWVSRGCSGRRSGLRDGSREPPADSAAIQSRGLRTEPRPSTALVGRENVPGQMMFRTECSNIKLIDL